MKRLIVSCSCIAMLLACEIVYAQTLQPLQPSHAASQEGLSDQQQATSDANIDAQRDVNGHCGFWEVWGAVFVFSVMLQ